MWGGKHRSRQQVVQDVRKGSLLSADERATVRRLAALRMNAVAIGRAIGRSAPDVQGYMDSPEFRHG